MITAYADETGTHGFQNGKDPYPGVYGFLATPEQWAAFRSKWKAALDNHGAPYFHFCEITPEGRKDHRNPFHDWDAQKVDDFIYDMAIVASLGPVPFGGYNSVERLFSGRKDKAALYGSYETALDVFFEDFGITMDEHFPNERGQTAFVFDSNTNPDWQAIVGKTIADARKRDGRIGSHFYEDDRNSQADYQLQAADLFSYINRQYSETLYRMDAPQPGRLLDFILGRNAAPRGHWFRRYANMPDDEWIALVNRVRAHRIFVHNEFKVHGIKLPRHYYPLRDHPEINAHRLLAKQQEQRSPKRDVQ